MTAREGLSLAVEQRGALSLLSSRCIFRSDESLPGGLHCFPVCPPRAGARVAGPRTESGSQDSAGPQPVLRTQE